MTLTKGDITFLFDDGVAFKESYDFVCSDSAEAMRRLRKVAGVRTPLLAKNVQIVRLNVKGVKQESVRMRGTGGDYANPRFALKLLRNSTSDGCGQSYQRRLRGVPETAKKFGVVSAQVRTAMQAFSRVLTESQCTVKARAWPEEVVKDIRIHDWTTLLSTWAKKLPKKKLIKLLGEDEGTKMFEVRKAKRTAEEALV